MSNVSPIPQSKVVLAPFEQDQIVAADNTKPLNPSAIIEAFPQISLVKEFSAFSSQIISTLTEVSKIAEKGPVNIMLGWGVVLTILAVILKLQIGSVKVSDITPAEFITVIITATILIILGGLFRLYTYKKEREIKDEITRAQQKIGADLLTRASITGSELLKETTITAQKIVEPSPTPQSEQDLLPKV